MLLAWFDVLFDDVSEFSVELLELGDVEDVVVEPLREPEVLLVLDGVESELLLVVEDGEEFTLIFVSEEELLGVVADD